MFMRNKNLSAELFVVCLFFCSIACFLSAEWSNQENRDEMTGKVVKIAFSKDSSPSAPMSFPYQNITGNIFVGKNDTSEFVTFGFTEQPNLLNIELQPNMNIIKTRVKWDDKVEVVKLVQKWGDKFLHFSDSKSAIKKIMSSKEVLLELDWYGSGRVYFKFDLSGASEAIANIRK